MQPKGGYTLLYFVKSKNDTKCKNFVDLLCSYVNTFILVYFLRFQEGGGGYSPYSPPPKSATGYDAAMVAIALNEIERTPRDPHACSGQCLVCTIMNYVQPSYVT